MGNMILYSTKKSGGELYMDRYSNVIKQGILRAADAPAMPRGKTQGHSYRRRKRGKIKKSCRVYQQGESEQPGGKSEYGTGI